MSYSHNGGWVRPKPQQFEMHPTSFKFLKDDAFVYITMEKFELIFRFSTDILQIMVGMENQAELLSWFFEKEKGYWNYRKLNKAYD